MVRLVNHIVVRLTAGCFDAMLAAGSFLKSTLDMMAKLKQHRTIN